MNGCSNTNRKSKKITLQAMIFPVLDVMLNGVNFIIIMLVSYYISPKGYGILSAHLALASILFIVGISIQTYVAKEITNHTEADLRQHFKFIIRRIILILNGTMILLSPLLIHILKGQIYTIILVMVMLDANIILGYKRGVLQGKFRFFQLNINFYIEVLSKLCLILLLLPRYRTYETALLGFTIGMGLALLHSIYIERGTVKHHTPLKLVGKSKIGKQIWHIGMGHLFIYFMTGMNIIVINYRFEESAAAYALSTKFSLLVVAVGFSIITVILPYASKYKDQPKYFEKFVYKSVIALIGFLGLITVFYKVALPTIVPYLFKEGYTEMIDYVVIQSFAYVFLGSSYFLIHMLMLQGNRKYITALVAFGSLFTLLLTTLIKTVTMVVYAELAIYITLLIILLMIFKRKELKL